MAAGAATGVVATGGPADHSGANGQPSAGNGNGNGNGRAAEEAPQTAGGRVKASPLARKLAAASSVELARVRGTGPNGRIIRRDIEAFLQSPGRPRRGRAGPGRWLGTRADSAPAAAQRIPHSRMRKTIAQRMVQAKQAAPEIHLTVDIRADRLVASREELNSAWHARGSSSRWATSSPRPSPWRSGPTRASTPASSPTPSSATARSISASPSPSPEGLIVPVLHRADTLGLREIRKRSEALAAAARSNSLSGEQLTGSTFTISNLGMYGIRQFDAILNMPEVGILAVGGAEKRPVVEGDKLVVGTVMSVTLTADHRAVDGAMAAEFLQTLKGLLEEPTSMLL